MKRPEPTKGQTWVNLGPRDFPTMPKQVGVDIKGDRGYVDLTFSNTVAYVFQPAVRALLDCDMSVHRATGSAVIGMEAPPFQVANDVEASPVGARAALGAASRLVALFRRSRAELERAAEAATLPRR